MQTHAHWAVRANLCLAIAGLLFLGIGQAAAQPFAPTYDSGSATAADGAASEADSAVSFIDSALLRSTMRLRFDSAYENNRPTRSEFFYPKTGITGRGPLNTREISVDYQDINLYGEFAPCGSILSGFIEAPFRMLNPVVNPNESGPGDLNAGFKLALARSSDANLTFQFRTYAPTGEGRRGLGTEHVSLEPAVLWNVRLLEAMTLEGEFRYWTPIGGTDFAGDVIRYGLGLGYSSREVSEFWISPIAEFVGWTVLSGKEYLNPIPLAVSARGDTILNAALGVRVGWCDNWDAYVGYNRCLTGDVWYRDAIRAEVRLFY